MKDRKVVVWAGDSIYAIVEFPEMLDNNYFRRVHLPAILKDAIEDFGSGVTIKLVDDGIGDRFEIDVSACECK